MKKTKSLISVFIALLLTLSICTPALAASDSKDTATESFVEAIAPTPQQENETSDTETVSASDQNLKVTAEKALNLALTAAKSKYAIEGVSGDVAAKAVVTKLKYNKKSGSFAVTIRADRVNKYTCDISVKKFFSAEIGMPENSEYVHQGKIAAFFCQGAEKFSYFFIRLFKQDGPRE